MTKKRNVSFSGKVETEEIGSPGERKTMNLKGRSREEMEEYPFAKMLADYAEKERLRFFDYGGIGHKWTKHTHFPHFDNLFKDALVSGLAKKEDGLPFSLITISVKDYPLQTLRDAYSAYLSFKVDGPTLNPDIKEFNPFSVKTTELKRSCPRRILDTTMTKPLKPPGPAPPRRPTTSCRIDPTEDKGPSDINEKIAELEKRIKRIQNMAHTPLCLV